MTLKLSVTKYISDKQQRAAKIKKHKQRYVWLDTFAVNWKQFGFIKNLFYFCGDTENTRPHPRGSPATFFFFLSVTPQSRPQYRGIPTSFVPISAELPQNPLYSRCPHYRAHL